MSDLADLDAAPRSVILGRDLPPDPRALAATSLADFEPIAQERMHPRAFDYVAGGSWDEISLRENVAAWQRYRFRPRVLVDVGRVDPATNMLGRPVSFPVATAPMAVHALAHPEGELATARAAAAAAGVPFTLSTMSSRSMEEVAEAGVARALAILKEEFEVALTLLGTPRPADLTRAHLAMVRP